MSKRGSSVKRFSSRRYHEGKSAYWQGRGPGHGKAAAVGYIRAHHEVMADVEEMRAARADADDIRRGLL